MFNKFRTYLVIIAIALVSLLAINWLFFRNSGTTWGESIDGGMVNVPIPAGDTLMSFGRCREFTDSMKRIEEWKTRVNKGQGGDGVEFGIIGVRKVNDCYDCGHSGSFRKTYLLLPGYTLRDPRNTSFYIDSDKNYLKYVKWDTALRTGSGGTFKNGHYEKKQVPFRFAFEEQEKPGGVLIPINARSYNILVVGLQILYMLITLFLAYIVFYLPILLLIRIASGKIFLYNNIRLMHLVAWSLIIVPLVYVLVQFILRLSFHRYITEDLSLNWLGTLADNKSSLIAGIVTFIFARAFKRGYRLQNEQDLTI